MVRVAVIGAGVNGLASGVKIKQKYPEIEVAIIADKFTPETTGDGSGGLWYPYLCGNTAEHLLSMRLASCHFYRNGQRMCMDGYHLLQDYELEYLNQLYSGEFVEGHTFMTFIVPPKVLLLSLFEQFKAAGGVIINNKVSRLNDDVLSSYDVVINCSGLGSRELVPDDRVYPIRGQIVKLKANWIHATIIDEDEGNYIIPNYDTCVLGGTHQENNINTNPDDSDTEFILKGCQRLVPGLKNAEILDIWVGLRPGRDAVRLEPEIIDGKLYIHNYGHGGSGLTLFWGCATQVLQILESQLPLKKTANSK